MWVIKLNYHMLSIGSTKDCSKLANLLSSSLKFVKRVSGAVIECYTMNKSCYMIDFSTVAYILSQRFDQCP